MPDAVSRANPNTGNQIEKCFTYHRPPAEELGNFKRLRSQARELAHLINELVPDGREKATALTRLEEAIMHANAGIARQYPASDN